MFNIDKVPRKYFIGAVGALIVILLVVTLWQPTNFGYKDKTDYAAQIKQAQADKSEYDKLLASINVTQAQSEVALKKIATQEVVKEEVNASFNTSQKIVIPDVSNTELAIEPRGGKEAVVSYFNQSGAYVKSYNDKVAVANQVVFTDLQDSQTVNAAITETAKAVSDLKRMPVPTEALAFHKAQIVALQQYGDFLTTAKSYNPRIVSEQLRPRGDDTQQPWPKVYKDYAIISNKSTIISTEYKQLDKKYSISQLPIFASDGNSSVSGGQPSFGLINEAHAIFGIADTTIVVGDIPQLIIYGIKQGLLKAFSTFIIKAIDKLVAKIDKYFTITSQLYYSQELGKLYTNEYWKKFKVPLADQNILANFIPDYFCVPTDLNKLKQVFEAKSKQLLKYDIKTIALNSPNFYDALAELGTAAQINPEAYWSDYYSSFAAQSKAAAADAATKEVTSPGVKSGRDLIKGSVDKTLSKILDVQQGSVSSALNLGSTNADNLISVTIAGIFENLTTKFIFTAVNSSDHAGGLGVVQESNICLGTAKYKPVVAGPSDPGDAKAAADAQVQACRTMLATYDSLPQASKDSSNESLVKNCRDIVGSAGGAPAP